MHPIAFSIGSLQIHWYGITLSAAMALGVALFHWVGVRRGYHADFLADVSLWMLVGGILGARIDSALHGLDRFAQNPFWILNLREGGFAIHGAIFGGMLGNILRFRKSGYPLLEGLDMALAILLPPMALGRVGCLLQGCCVGKITESAWGITYPGTTVARYPVQMFEAGLDLLFWPLVLLVFFRSARQGQTVCAMLATYSFIRFTAEFFRETPMWGPLTREQWGSVSIFAVAILALLLYKGPPRYKPAEGGDEPPRNPSKKKKGRS